MENQNLKPKQTNSWSKSEQESLLKVLTVLINGQKPYGKEYSVSDTFLYYKMKLDGKYTAEQIMKAVDIYTDKKNDVPAPADIIRKHAATALPIKCDAIEQKSLDHYSTELTSMCLWRHKSRADCESCPPANQAPPSELALNKLETDSYLGKIKSIQTSPVRKSTSIASSTKNSQSFWKRQQLSWDYRPGPTTEFCGLPAQLPT